MVTEIIMQYHNDEKNSHKYWRARLRENLNGTDAYVTSTYGRISGYGRSGTEQSTTKMFATRKQAERFLINKIREKFRKGYSDLGGDYETSSEPIEVKTMEDEEELIFYAHRILRM